MVGGGFYMKKEEKFAGNTQIAYEDLAEKKAKIYARLLIDPFLAEEMEFLAVRHSDRKQRLMSIEEGGEV
jgi:hypothetical protein